MHTPAPVHIGHQPPGADAHLPQRSPAGLELGEQIRVSALDKVEVDWSKYEIEPRWIGSETADCVAALQPGWYHLQGDRERDRYLEGAAGRGETALVISMLGFAHDTKPTGFMGGGGGDSVELAKTMNAVSGYRLPTATTVRLAAGLTLADEDLGKRLLNRPGDSPWWSLDHYGHTTIPGAGGPPVDHPAIGELVPILVDPLGNPVVAVWLSPDQRIRWYIVPDDTNWNSILDWLIHQAIPATYPRPRNGTGPRHSRTLRSSPLPRAAPDRPWRTWRVATPRNARISKPSSPTPENEPSRSATACSTGPATRSSTRSRRCSAQPDSTWSTWMRNSGTHAPPICW